MAGGAARDLFETLAPWIRLNPLPQMPRRKLMIPIFGQGISIANYDVTRDGRFIMLRRGASGGGLHAVINWTEELKHVLAAGGVR